MSSSTAAMREERYTMDRNFALEAVRVTDGARQ
jgi:hypothetical protein